jgi:transposase
VLEAPLSSSLQRTTLESLEIGATPLVRHFLERLRLPELFEQHLGSGHGRRPAVSAAATLLVLISNLLLGRRPLYAMPDWVRRRVPEHLGLRADQINYFHDDRFGWVLDRLYRADRASLLVAVVKRAVEEFDIDLEEMHNDTTTVTMHGRYAKQAPANQADRPPLITLGYNKDHRPDLKQLLFSITVSADGAVPIHGKIYDGNTTDDQVHRETWQFLRDLVGDSDFLYVADSKLCTRDNMGFIAEKKGRFLTVMPATRKETQWFRAYAKAEDVKWVELWREEDPRNRQGPPIVYEGVESPQKSEEGYRVLWYRSSQKKEEDRRQREGRLESVRKWAEKMRASQKCYGTAKEAEEAGQKLVQQEGVEKWVRVRVVEEVTEEFKQTTRGRPGPKTIYQRRETTTYRVELEEDKEAVQAEARCDGLFPLVSNDKGLTVEEALVKYKYQPYVEKRHEQLKSVFGVMPVWLKSVERVASLLWVYYVVELVQALIEREVRKRMEEAEVESMKLYPERRKCEAPTSELVFAALEGHRRHRLMDGEGNVLHVYHDALSDAGKEVLELLEIDAKPYGVV